MKRIVIPVIVFLFCISHALGNPITDKRYDSWIREYTAMFFHDEISPAYIKAIAISESALKPDAESYVGARGLMQFMPSTWIDVAPEPWRTLGPFDPEAAIFVGVKYMRWLWLKFPDAVIRQRKALSSASYNSGLGNIYKARSGCRDDQCAICNATIEIREIIRGQGCDPEIWDYNVNVHLVTSERSQKETINYVRNIRSWELKLIQSGAM